MAADYPRRRFILTARALLAVAAISLLAAGLSAQQDAESVHARIERLIERLGDDDYNIREQAQKELAELGFAAFDALSVATEHEDLEIASRAKYLLRLIRVQWIDKSDSSEVRRLLADYEYQPPEERLLRMSTLARLPGGDGIAALCRLVRFETSELFSKYAAVKILSREPVDADGQGRWAKTLKQNLDHSPRTAARWLSTYIELADKPAAALNKWTELVKKEETLQKKTPTQSSPSIVVALLYRLAEAEVGQKQRESANQTAERARKLNPVKTGEQLLAYLDVVQHLQQRGLFDWAEAEYRRVIETGVPEYTAFAYTGLAEMLHDQGKNLQAAESLQGLVKPVDNAKLQGLEFLQRSVAEIRARVNYFFACHWADEGDLEKHREYLDEALAVDPGEIDALIARHRLADQDPDHRRKTEEMIAAAAGSMREEINRNPDSAINYNQFAWLVGNTEGDREEALKFALKAVELSPDSGAYYDTTAHVYFAGGDYENAVKYQAQAAQLDPHSGLIARQLKVFRKKLAESKLETPAQNRGKQQD